MYYLLTEVRGITTMPGFRECVQGFNYNMEAIFAEASRRDDGPNKPNRWLTQHLTQLMTEWNEEEGVKFLSEHMSEATSNANLHTSGKNYRDLKRTAGHIEAEDAQLISVLVTVIGEETKRKRKRVVPIYISWERGRSHFRPYDFGDGHVLLYLGDYLYRMAVAVKNGEPLNYKNLLYNRMMELLSHELHHAVNATPLARDYKGHYGRKGEHAKTYDTGVDDKTFDEINSEYATYTSPIEMEALLSEYMVKAVLNYGSVHYRTPAEMYNTIMKYFDMAHQNNRDLDSYALTKDIGMVQEPETLRRRRNKMATHILKREMSRFVKMGRDKYLNQLKGTIGKKRFDQYVFGHKRGGGKLAPGELGKKSQIREEGRLVDRLRKRIQQSVSKINQRIGGLEIKEFTITKTGARKVIYRLQGQDRVAKREHFPVFVDLLKSIIPVDMAKLAYNKTIPPHSVMWDESEFPLLTAMLGAWVSDTPDDQTMDTGRLLQDMFLGSNLEPEYWEMLTSKKILPAVESHIKVLEDYDVSSDDIVRKVLDMAARGDVAGIWDEMCIPKNEDRPEITLELTTDEMMLFLYLWHLPHNIRFLLSEPMTIEYDGVTQKSVDLANKVRTYALKKLAVDARLLDQAIDRAIPPYLKQIATMAYEEPRRWTRVVLELVGDPKMALRPRERYRFRAILAIGGYGEEDQLGHYSGLLTKGGFNMEARELVARGLRHARMKAPGDGLARLIESELEESLQNE